MDRERDSFLRTWSSHLRGIKSIIFDFTSLSCYLKINDFVEWGYNRDGDDMALKRDKIFSLYRARDFVEHLFDIQKNEIRENRIRVSSRVSMEGRLFVNFISLLLYGALDRRMKEKSLYKKYSVPEILHELKKLRYVEMTSAKGYLTEITKKQRDIYNALEVPIPVET